MDKARYFQGTVTWGCPKIYLPELHAVSGACKDSKLYSSYHAMQDLVLCPPSPGKEINYECVRGLCDSCGFFEWTNGTSDAASFATYGITFESVRGSTARKFAKFAKVMENPCEVISTSWVSWAFSRSSSQ